MNSNKEGSGDEGTVNVVNYQVGIRKDITLNSESTIEEALVKGLQNWARVRHTKTSVQTTEPHTHGPLQRTDLVQNT